MPWEPTVQEAQEPEIVRLHSRETTEWEYQVHHQGLRLWVDAWIITPARDRSKSPKIKFQRVYKHLYGDHAGKIVVSDIHFTSRWLTTTDQRARLRRKEQNDGGNTLATNAL